MTGSESDLQKLRDRVLELEEKLSGMETIVEHAGATSSNTAVFAKQLATEVEEMKARVDALESRGTEMPPGRGFGRN